MQSPSEADSEPSDDRIAAIFQEIDTWTGEFNKGMISIFTNPSIDKTFVGLGVSKAFRDVLFEQDDKLDRLPSRVDNAIAWFCTSTKASDLYHLVDFLIPRLNLHKKHIGVEEFIQEIKQDIKLRPHWQIPSSNSEFQHAWSILWTVLNFDRKIPIRVNTFQGQMRELFPDSSQKSQPSTMKFSTNLRDIESVEFIVKPTANLNDHLLIEGDTVNIFKVSVEDIQMLNAYAKNKAAIALRIATLGKEVLSSLRALYAEDETFSKAEDLGIFAPQSELDRLLSEGCLRECVDTPPKVLSCRAYELQKQINRRRSWWWSLVRDMKKQSRTQPLVFYGAILAAFFGVCTIIQTVTSVWSLVLALQATK